jgi:hypothetical protein
MMEISGRRFQDPTKSIISSWEAFEAYRGNPGRSRRGLFAYFRAIIWHHLLVEHGSGSGEALSCSSHKTLLKRRGAE